MLPCYSQTQTTLGMKKYEDNIPGFDTVHELIYEKLTKTDLRGMKQGAGKKGKGSATRTSKKVSN